MVVVSCSGKFHAFNLAEELSRQKKLSFFFTSYAYQKDVLFRSIAKRIDKENIPPSYIKTNMHVAFGLKLSKDKYKYNEVFDSWVSKSLSKVDYNVFIGWSGMSLHSMEAVKRKGKIAILERGSSHILYQNQILNEEYSKFGIDFSIDSRVIEKELMEYELADYISIPSQFVKKSFIEKGINPNKLFVNNYGVSTYFTHAPVEGSKRDKKFRILYLGGITIQKGLVYLFEALSQLRINQDNYEVWFLGTIEESMKKIIPEYAKQNWKFFGHVNHYQLLNYINNCDVAVQPSLQEGLSMVIPQIMACGVPVIASTNSGGEDIIENNVNGFIVPIRSPSAIKEKIEQLYDCPELLERTKANLKAGFENHVNWRAYGNRYLNFLQDII